MPLSPVIAPEASTGDLVSYRVEVPLRDVVFVKGIIEASDGLGAVFARPVPKGPKGRVLPPGGGDLWITAHPSRERELVEVLTDLAREVGAVIAGTPRTPSIAATSGTLSGELPQHA